MQYYPKTLFSIFDWNDLLSTKSNFVTFVKHLSTVIYMGNTYIDRGRVYYTILGWVVSGGLLTVQPTVQPTVRYYTLKLYLYIDM